MRSCIIDAQGSTAAAPLPQMGDASNDGDEDDDEEEEKDADDDDDNDDNENNNDDDDGDGGDDDDPRPVMRMMRSSSPEFLTLRYFRVKICSTKRHLH